MTKAEAAEVLGVSTRAVERYVKAGRLTPPDGQLKYKRGATGQVLDLDPVLVERLAAELNAPQGPTQGATAPDRSDATSTDTTRADTSNATSTDSGPEVVHTAIVKAPRARGLVPVQADGGAQVVQVLAALLEEARQEATRQVATGRVSVPVEARLTLSLDEAVALSGVPKSILRTAISDGSLAAKKLGRSWKIHREILEAWVKEACR